MRVDIRYTVPFLKQKDKSIISTRKIIQNAKTRILWEKEAINNPKHPAAFSSHSDYSSHGQSNL